MSSKRDRSDDSSDDCPWTSDKSEKLRTPGKMSNVFPLNGEEYLDVAQMHGELIQFSTGIVEVVNGDGWNAIAVQRAVGAIDRYLAINFDEFRGCLLSGLIKRNENMEMELLLTSEVRKVSYLIFVVNDFERNRN